MQNNIHQYDKDKIKFCTFNLSGKGNGIQNYYHRCSKYLKTFQILFRGQYGNKSKSRKALLSGYNMINSNLIGKIS